MVIADLTLANLIAGIITLTPEIEAADHLGRHNRLFYRRMRLLKMLTDHEACEEGFLKLLHHENPDVRLNAAWHCRYNAILPDPVTETLKALTLLPGKTGGSARTCLTRQDFTHNEPATAKNIPYLPPPRGFTNSQAQAIIREAFPDERGRSILDLLRASIRIWPKPAPLDPVSSRFGGLPAVPFGWSWPIENDEPLLFLGQINCAEVRAAAGSISLPGSGLLAFFGDHDDVNGCGPTGGGKVYHFPDTGSLYQAVPPLDDLEPLISCGLLFYDYFELPDPLSKAIVSLELSKTERDNYCDLVKAISTSGFPDRWDKYNISKLFGWSNLVQRDLEAMEYPRKPDAYPTLLIQIGWYHSEADWECWGPGGLVYFTLDRSDLAAGRFDAAELEMQCT